MTSQAYSMPQTLPLLGGHIGGTEAGAFGVTNEALVIVRACEDTVAAPKPVTARERTKTRINVFFMGKSPWENVF